jgi:hypothetical protein
MRAGYSSTGMSRLQKGKSPTSPLDGCRRPSTWHLPAGDAPLIALSLRPADESDVRR